jgi:hypothetical protein
MPIQFKSLLSSTVTNQTFLDKTIDDATVGKIDLNAPNSANIADTQLFQNNLRSDVDSNEVRITDLELGTIKLREYISDTAYQTANGVPSGGEIYYNSTTGLSRYYDGVDAAWKDVGAQVVGIQERIGVGDGVTVDFNLTNAPLNDEAINLYANGLIIEKSDYSYSAPTITFNSAPAAGQVIYVSYLSEGNPASPIVSAGTKYVIYKQLNASEISSDSFTLAVAPSVATNVIVDVINGTPQHYGVDFNVSGSTVNWSGLGLDGVLSAGDVLRLQYFA